MVYYNEHDPKTAAWLRELIKAGLIADGEVDTRSVVDVQSGDLWGFRQCHFFAGIGGWSYALRLAGWPDDRHVWTGSCPCQPFSSAGKGRGKEDARHLWPQFRRLIRQCRPSVVFGEQVASAAGRVWLSAVFADLEALAYRAAGADLCAAGVGAPHIRQRLYFVADSLRGASERGTGSVFGAQAALSGARFVNGNLSGEPRSAGAEARRCGEAGNVGDTVSQGFQERERNGGIQRETMGALKGQAAERGGDVGELADVNGGQSGDVQLQRGRGYLQRPENAVVGFWSECDWLPCRDGKARPVEPGAFPLAHGIPARVGRLRGYGNAIVPQVAAGFVQSYLGSVEDAQALVQTLRGTHG